MIKFGILGMGRIGERHQSCIRKNPRAELVGVYDIDPDVNDHPLAVGSERELFQKADAICICTPNYLHAYQAIDAMKYDCDVLIEKPMAIDKAEATRVLSVAKANERKVAVVHQNRTTPIMMWLREIIERDLIGEIIGIDVQCFWNRNRAYYESSPWRSDYELSGGVIFNQFIHFVDACYFLFGNIAVEYTLAAFERPGFMFPDQHRAVVIYTDTGCQGSFTLSVSAEPENYTSRLMIQTSLGVLEVSGQFFSEVEKCTIPDLEVPNFQPLEQNVYKDGSRGTAAGMHAGVIDNFVDYIEGKVVSPIATCEDGMIVTNICHDMTGI